VIEDLWNAQRCAAFLGYSVDYFRKKVRYWDGAPKPVTRTGRDRWLASDWREWAIKSRAMPAK